MKTGSGVPPWHLWGGSQTLELNLPAASATVDFQRGQLSRIAYKRPETWHWLFTCRLLEASNADPLEPLQVSVNWELTTGIGRSMQQNLGFDNFNILWGTPTSPSDIAPVGTLIWTTQTIAATPRRAQFLAAPATEPVNFIDQLVAQDIQLNVRATLVSPVTPRANAKRAVIEVGAQWAPKTHLRPEWHLDHFPGGEQ